ncbi:hypothetical protein CQ12_22915 [Bradyrhizobium jicamae]|uniref:Uncharacterized protein n=2 Tax=Bradyrhizobium jicamae TaxID=280332 RepID=A0A0R3LXV7_9BRAD|nr:hypothetical protein CQ12_22915 [Bradyrhizobium jicamae]
MTQPLPWSIHLSTRAVGKLACVVFLNRKLICLAYEGNFMQQLRQIGTTGKSPLIFAGSRNFIYVIASEAKQSIVASRAQRWIASLRSQ